MTARRTRVPRLLAGTDDRTPKPDGRRRTSKMLWGWVLAVSLALQLAAVYAPGGPAGPEINGLDKVVHVTIFFVPALAALMLGIRVRWVLGVLALQAPLSELVQHFALLHRDGDVSDVMADLGGVFLGWLTYVVWSRRHP